jgi:hypothetical protein
LSSFNLTHAPTASTDKPPITQLAAGDTVTLVSTATRNGYRHVRTADGKVGWVLARNLSVGGAAANNLPLHANAPAAAAPTPGSEAVDNPSCPAEGTSHRTGDAKKDDELRNRAKRFVAKQTAAVMLAVPDSEALQADTDPDAADHIHKQLPRNLTNKHAGTHIVSEGDRVSVTGFLHRAEEDSAAESVNCAGVDGRDIHLNIGATAPHPTFNEWAGIVVEVIPQVPLPGWTQQQHSAVLSALKAVRDDKLPVLAVGSLTYDNEHQVNSDKNHPRGTNPKRISLWEVRPVLEFYVCPQSATCDPTTPNAKWETLKEWKAKQPQ